MKISKATRCVDERMLFKDETLYLKVNGRCQLALSGIS